MCDAYAAEYSITFNASKSKSLVVLPKRLRYLYKYVQDCVFTIGGQPIEIVQSFNHLGHIITAEWDDNDDINKRRIVFVNGVSNILCFF